MKKLYGSQGGEFKLWQPVVVEEVLEGIACRYVGEVLSMKTTEGTYMVRRVPQHPGTLVEVQASQLSEPFTKARRMYVHYAEVSPFVPNSRKYFPVDMLRYDCCAPVNFKLVDGVAELIDDSLSEKRLLVASALVKSNPQWEDRRWRSFNWSIEPLHSERWEIP